ncbi:lysophospholipid acyltransferase family protein [Listeria costaricensis]|uniref:lysophospholipid acyltransferase family protein n=1 Tax=Listeria costaricensis TaxID=2026604 RepID=UPI000C0794F5|nr:1-acyl-sn-glycerol-3-phosphate acyltransferase [Listeria costaricensis]
MFYKFAKTVVHVILVLLGGRIKIQNKDKITQTPYVLVSPHTSWLEIIYLAFAVYPTQIHYMAKQELFKGKLLNWAMTHFGAFPVNRENPGPSAIKSPIRILKQGKVVGIFPSGTRSQANLHLKRGAVTIAFKGKVPILPAVYDGPKNFKEVLKRKPVYIRFGDYIYLDDTDKEQKEILEHKSNELLDTFATLQNEINATKKKK